MQVGSASGKTHCCSANIVGTEVAGGTVIVAGCRSLELDTELCTISRGKVLLVVLLLVVLLHSVGVVVELLNVHLALFAV
jgi:hypothetical protein